MLKFNFVSLVVIVIVMGVGCASDSNTTKVENRTPYTYPLASPGAKFGGLPPAAKNTVRAEVGSAEIVDVVPLYTGSTVPIYVVHFKNHELFPPMYVAADGSILHPDLSLAVGAAADRFGVSTGNAVSGLKPSELPQDVSRVIRERAPGAAIANISKETWGDRLVYILSFTDQEHHPTLYVAADGTVMNEGPK